MNLTKGTVIHDFEVKDVVTIADLDGTMYKMLHRKTGAQLVWMKRDDRNKTFAIAFKTIPSDDTGVFHILEHSVLNGSAKYPVREPFVELLKSSMQTFLNAFTYPDKTMYPVSSRNDKDFMNLVSVYMDAVFHPAIYTNPNIFYQEGWHYEIRNPEDEPIFKGVVLNEMKGAFSSVDEILIDEFNRMLYPDNCYKYVSGGDPSHIPDLSYEKFIETHQKFYHPSNARVWLDGDMNIDQVLAFIDNEYFSQYEKEDMDFRIPMQEAHAAVHHRCTYEVSPEEGTEDLTQIAIGKIISRFDEVEKNIAWSVLSDILVESNESPLKKNIISQDLGQDVELVLMDGIQQNFVLLNVRNTNEEHYDAIRKTVHDTAEQLVREGLDHSNIIAALNQMEFRFREKHEPAGLMYAQTALNTWLYEGQPETYLLAGSVFETLRKKTEEGYFEDLLAEFLLDDENLSTLIAVPDNTLGQKRSEEEAARCHAAKEAWGEDLQNYIDLNQKLDTWQAVPDSEEILNTLPKLSLSDVERVPENIPVEERTIQGVPILLHPADKTGIVYMTFYFSLGGVTKEYLPSLGLYTSLLTNLRTKNKTLQELQKAIRTNFGALSFWLDAYTPAGVHDSCIPVMAVSCSTLKKNIDQVVPLILEIMKETEYSPEMILPLLKQSTENNRQTVITNGHSIAMRRVSAHFTAEGAFREYVGGNSASLYEKNLEEHYDEKISSFINECRMYSEILFSKDRMTASITGEENLPVVEQMINGAGREEGMRAKVHYPLLKEPKEVIQIPAAIAYSAAVANMVDQGYSYDPRMQVLAHILTYDYLWTEVRVKGGAYGTGFSVSPSGNMGAYSYRDPDPMNAFRAFSEAGNYLKEAAERVNLEQMIIGTVASGDPLLSPAAKVRVADVRWFRGITFENMCKAREKMLTMTVEDLKKCAEIADISMKSCAQCVVASKDVTELCKQNDFKELVKFEA